MILERVILQIKLWSHILQAYLVLSTTNEGNLRTRDILKKQPASQDDNRQGGAKIEMLPHDLVIHSFRIC